MTTTNRAAIASLIESIDQFVDGELEIVEVQGKLQISLDPLERDHLDVASTIRLAEADLEEIQFAMLLDEQRPAAVFRLDSLRTALVAGLEEEEP